MVITIKNPNYGTFKTKNTTGYINYQDTIVAEVPIGPKIFPGHRTTNVSSIAGLMIGKLISDQKFLSDVAEDGSFNLTAKATLHGKVHLIKVFKVHILSALLELPRRAMANFTRAMTIFWQVGGAL
ncbi:hypothetical protein P8452_36280 [Trifolium repens]|nr:hypothetical protein P8452_36280 [Trifolium repens]